MTERQLVKSWSRVKVGTAVTVVLDNKQQRVTRTTSAPWMLGEDSSGKGGHTAVIMLEGITGCYMLRRVTLIKNGKAQAVEHATK